MTPAQTLTSMSILDGVAVETFLFSLRPRRRVTAGHIWEVFKKNLISDKELRSAHSHQLQKLLLCHSTFRSVLVTGSTETQLTYSLGVCTAVLFFQLMRSTELNSHNLSIPQVLTVPVYTV